MSYLRKQNRDQLKKEWKIFRKENKQYKNIPFSQFNKLWKDNILNTSQQNIAPVLTEEEESNLADMFVEEVSEYEDTTTE